MSDATPIFIVGSPRSGTTLMRLVINAHPEIVCGPETHILEDMRGALEARWKPLERYGFPKEYWHGRIRDFFVGFKEDHARARGKRRWADKTPRYVRMLPFIDELFPDAQVIHVIRDGRDVVASVRRIWGYRRAMKAAMGGWRDQVVAGREYGARLPSDRYHEVRYEDLALRPEETLRPLFAFLGEEWDPVVLSYDKTPRDGSRRQRELLEQRREGESAFFKSSVGAGGRKLDPILAATIRRTSQPLLRELGYITG